MRHDTVKPILNGHTIDSNLFCFRQLSSAQVYSTLVKDTLNLVYTVELSSRKLACNARATLARGIS